MAPHCMMWYILRKRNSQNYEDHERTMVELKKNLMFKTLYGWMTATNSACFSDFLEFLDCVLLSLPK